MRVFRTHVAIGTMNISMQTTGKKGINKLVNFEEKIPCKHNWRHKVWHMVSLCDLERIIGKPTAEGAAEVHVFYKMVGLKATVAQHYDPTYYQ